MELKVFDSYEQFKKEFDHEVKSHAEGYLRMGYLLRRAADTGVVLQGGYKSVAEFAKKEYHLNDDAVSKMIAINKRYSEGGYSDRISEQYRGFGASLLAEMLTLPDAVVDALPDSVNRDTIREIKNEIKEEEKITPLERMAEEKDPVQQEMDTTFARFMHQYYKENRRLYKELHDYVTSCCDRLDGNSRDFTLTHLAPNGEGVKMARIAGEGKCMLSIKGPEKPLELLVVWTNEAQKIPWSEAYETLRAMCSSASIEEDWERLYGEPWEKPEQKPEKPEQKPAEPERKPEEIEQRQEKRNENTDQDGTDPEDAGSFEESAADIGEGSESDKSDNCGAGESDSGTRSEEADENAESEGGDSEAGEEDAESEAAAGADNQESQENPEQKQGDENPETQVNTGAETDFAPAQERQGNIEDFPDVLPEGYVVTHDGTEVEMGVETGLWKVAAGHALRLFNTLEMNDWNPDAGKIVDQMIDETDKLMEALLAMKDAMGKRRS